MKSSDTAELLASMVAADGRIEARALQGWVQVSFPTGEVFEMQLVQTAPSAVAPLEPPYRFCWQGHVHAPHQWHDDHEWFRCGGVV